ncbi:hypothetical protein HYV12_02615 [Candidatus Dojkabacteria bacterium]|nr:hypothetical protein [Candidatus Dojkabacteria bacterium]
MKKSRNYKAYLVILIVVIPLLFLLYLGSKYIYSQFVTRYSSDPLNNLPGEVIAKNVKQYAVTKSGKTVFYLTEEKKDDSYYSNINIYMIESGIYDITVKIDTVRIGGGYSNSKAHIIPEEDNLMLYIEGYAPPGSNHSSNLCREYNLKISRFEKKESLSNTGKSTYLECKEAFIGKFPGLINPLYSTDINFDSTFEIEYPTSIDFKEFDGALKSETYLYIPDSSYQKTILKLGDKTYSAGGGFSISSNGYFLDNERNLYVKIGSDLHRISVGKQIVFR